MSAKYERVFRAGIIPFVYGEDGTPIFMFMKPSDPTYGGDSWQIAKGRVEGDDDNFTTALREGGEELGLKEDNIISISELGSFLGSTAVYVAHVKSMDDFAPFHYETGAVKWMTLEEFKVDNGRQLHTLIVKAAHDAVTSHRSYYMSDSTDQDPT